MEDWNKSTDEEIYASCLGGNADAFYVLVERYKDRLLQFVSWAAPEHAGEAEDIVQEIFIRLHSGRARYGGKSSFRTWLFGVARITALDWRRSFLRGIWGRTDCGDADELFADIPDGGAELSSALEKAENTAIIREALESLSPGLKTALLLKEWEGLSYEEMAAVMDVPEGTVRSRLHNARAALAKILTERFGL